MTAPGPDAEQSTTASGERRGRLASAAGVAGLVGGLAIAVLADPVPLRWLGAAFVALGVALLGAPLTQPSGTGDEDPSAVTLEDGRPGSAFAWSRFAPGMTIVVLLSAAGFLGGTGLALLGVGLVVSAIVFGLVGLMFVGMALRFLPTMRGRRVVVLADAVVVEMRGERAELPWATITAVDVARPAPRAAAMGGAITMRVLEHDVPGPPRLQRRLRNLAAPYGAAADIALPVAGLRHDPGALLAALERGPRAS